MDILADIAQQLDVCIEKERKTVHDEVSVKLPMSCFLLLAPGLFELWLLLLSVSLTFSIWSLLSAIVSKDLYVGSCLQQHGAGRRSDQPPSWLTSLEHRPAASDHSQA